jgi:hypothetical protein
MELIPAERLYKESSIVGALIVSFCFILILFEIKQKWTNDGDQINHGPVINLKGTGRNFQDGVNSWIFEFYKHLIIPGCVSLLVLIYVVWSFQKASSG